MRRPSLPQYDTDPTRRDRLARTRAGYRYRAPEDNALWPVSVAQSFPWRREQLDHGWALPFLPGFLKAQATRARKLTKFGLQKAIGSYDQLDAYEDMFDGEVPDFVQRWDDDGELAWRRVAGPNPLSLERVTSLSDLRERMPAITDAAVAFAGVRLDASIAAGRLFVIDYRLLQGALRPRATRASRWRGTYLPAPVALFVEQPGWSPWSQLRPLAIQIEQADCPDPNPLLHPDDSNAWRTAKHYVEVADQSLHVGVGHVYRTHLLIEPFCMATGRQLADAHPVAVLLQPHLRYTLGANQAAYANFVDEHQVYQTFYSGTLEETREIVKSAWGQLPFRELGLEAECRSRGVWDHLEEYPYRDDARLYLGPIHRFVEGYLRLFYRTDAEVQTDAEIQAWIAELGAPEGGNLRGLLDGPLRTVDQLVELLAQVLFICGPGHASQHFSQMHYYRHPPSFAESAYRPPPVDPTRATYADWMASLPPIVPASLRFCYSQFGDFQLDRFAHYERYALGSVAVTEAVCASFREELSEIERTLVERDRRRTQPYPFLRPSRVPNSINI